MVDALGDRWSYYLTPEEAQQVKANRENTYVGIGITVGQNVEDGLEILRVTEGSPAQEAASRQGRLSVGWMVRPSHPTTGDHALQPSRGGRDHRFPGSGGDGRGPAHRRGHPPGDHGVTATWTMTENQVGLVTILNFYAGTADLVKQGVAALQEEGAQALVFDLRNNPGGYVTELTEILDYLLPEGNIFISRTNDGEEVTYTSDASCVDLPMAVLVNANSYSAAEFFAAQLPGICGRSGDRGADQRQGVFPDPLRFARRQRHWPVYGRYYTGKGVSLIGTGLTPDTEVTLSEEDQQRLLAGELTPAEDAQFQAAVAALGLS